MSLLTAQDNGLEIYQLLAGRDFCKRKKNGQPRSGIFQLAAGMNNYVYCVHDKKSNKAWYSFYGNIYNQKSFGNKSKLKVISHDELKKTMISIIKILKKFGKKKLILMTSPNHLATTYQNIDVKIADNISKSVFCSVFKELESMNDVEYFPCYEIFLRDNQKKINKYRKDQLHVSNKFTNKILLKYFKKSFF